MIQQTHIKMESYEKELARKCQILVLLYPESLSVHITLGNSYIGHFQVTDNYTQSFNNY